MSRGFVLPSQISPPITAAASAVSAQGSSYVATEQGTSSGTFVGLTTAQTVTLTTGTAALVFLSCNVYNLTAGVGVLMGFAISGATTTAASNPYSASFYNQVGGVNTQLCAVYPVVLTAGSNTFTAQFATNGGTAQYRNRTIAVLVVS